jgi:thiamine kinase
LNAGDNTRPAAERVLGTLPGMAGARIEAVLSAGPTNASYRVKQGDSHYVLRLDKPDAARLGLDRDSEQAVLAAIAAAGIGPGAILFDANSGVSLRCFEAGRSWTRADLGKPDNLRRLAALLARLHSLPPTGRTFDPAAAAQRYAAQLGSGQAEELCGRIRDLQQQIAEFEPPTALCHNDLVCENILQGDRLQLIDWEYAGPGDPFFDLAVVIQHHGLDEYLAETLSEYYLGRAARPQERERLQLQQTLYQALLDLWHLRTGE